MVALEIAKPDGAVAGAQIDPSFTRHVDFDIYPVACGVNANHADLVRKTNFQLDRVSGLVFQHFDAALADLPAFSRDPGFDGVLVPGVHADVGVGCLLPADRACP